MKKYFFFVRNKIFYAACRKYFLPAFVQEREKTFVQSVVQAVSVSVEHLEGKALRLQPFNGARQGVEQFVFASQ